MIRTVDVFFKRVIESTNIFLLFRGDQFLLRHLIDT